MYNSFKKLNTLLAKFSLVTEQLIVQDQIRLLCLNRTLNEAICRYDVAVHTAHFPRQLAQEYHLAIQKKDIRKIESLNLEVEMVIEELLRKYGSI
jgi:cell division protein FtsL